MATQETTATARPERKEEVDNRILLEEGAAALTDRLGPSGMLRFLALVGGGTDRFEDVRREWEDTTREQVLATQPAGVAPMNTIQPRTHAPPVAPSAQRNDIVLLHEGEQALEERLGAEGLVRFLQLIGGGRPRFEDLREEWQGMGMDEALAAMGIQPPPSPEDES